MKEVARQAEAEVLRKLAAEGRARELEEQVG